LIFGFKDLFEHKDVEVHHLIFFLIPI